MTVDAGLNQPELHLRRIKQKAGRNWDPVGLEKQNVYISPEQPVFEHLHKRDNKLLSRVSYNFFSANRILTNKDHEERARS